MLRSIALGLVAAVSLPTVGSAAVPDPGACAPPPASPPGNAKPEARHLIILGGGKTEAEAAAAAADFEKVRPRSLKIPAACPQTVMSETVEGLKPGFWISVVGSCTKQEDAQFLVDVLRADFPGIYSRKFKTAWPERCPTLPWTKEVRTRGSEPPAEQDARRGSPLKLRVDANPEAPCGKRTLRISVVHAPTKRVVANMELNDECSGGECADCPSFAVEHRFGGFSTVGDRALVETTKKRWANDNDSTSIAVFGFECGKLVEVLSQQSHILSAPGVSLEFAPSPRRPLPSLAVVEDDAGDDVERRYDLAFDRATCSYSRVDVIEKKRAP